MSISGMAKTAVDSAYAFRFINLMRKEFNQWDAFAAGIIDANGNVLRRPRTDEEKKSYTPFHGAIRSLKKTLSTVPGVTAWTVMTSSLSAIGSRFGLSEAEIEMIESEMEPLLEEMVAGDAGGNPTNIASGTTSGAITLPGPSGPKKKTKEKKFSENWLSEDE